MKTDLIVEIIKTTISNNPFTSLDHLKTLIYKVLGIQVSKELIRVAIHAHGFSKKKARFYGQPKNLEIKTKEFIQQ